MKLIPRHFPYLTLMLLALQGIIHLIPGTFELFYFNSSYVAQGEWWRVFTSQLVHLDLTHLGYNVGTLFILGWLLEEKHRWQLVPVLLLGATLVAAYLPLSALWRYCGLSGAISALVLPVIWFLWKEQRSVFPWIVGILYLGRLLWELITGTPLVTNLEWPSHPPAHLAGLVAGLLWLTGLKYVKVVGKNHRRLTNKAEL